MGRPLHKRFFGEYEDLGTQLAPNVAWIPGEASSTNDVAFISQTGTRKFMARNNITQNEGIVRLTNTLTVTEGTSALLCYPRIESTGSGFTLGTTFTFELSGFEILNSGTGYAVNDVITITGGTASTNATLTVTEVSSSGAVKKLSVTNRGNYSVLPTTSQLDNNLPTGGTGSNLALKVNFGLSSISIGSGGTGYPNGTNSVVIVVRQQNGNGIGSIFLGNVTGGAVTSTTLFARGKNYRPPVTLELLQIYAVDSPKLVRTILKNRVKTWDNHTYIWDRFGLANFSNSCLLRVI